MSDTSELPKGWYADPDGSPYKRYWDGVRWTEYFDTPEYRERQRQKHQNPGGGLAQSEQTAEGTEIRHAGEAQPEPLVRTEKLTIWPDRIECEGAVRAIDATVQAAVYLDGAKEHLLEFGISKVPGLEQYIHRRKDTRQAEFQVGGFGWVTRLQLRPREVNEWRSYARLINAAADAARLVGMARSVAGDIHELVRLRDAGSLTDDEFSVAKARLLGAA